MPGRHVTPSESPVEGFANSRISPTMYTASDSDKTQVLGRDNAHSRRSVAPLLKAAGINARFDRMLERVNTTPLPANLSSSSPSSSRAERKRRASLISGNPGTTTPVDSYDAFESGRLGDAFRILKPRKRQHNSTEDTSCNVLPPICRSPLPDWLARTFSTLDEQNPLRLLAPPGNSSRSFSTDMQADSVCENDTTAHCTSSETDQGSSALTMIDPSCRASRDESERGQVGGTSGEYVFAFSPPPVLGTHTAPETSSRSSANTNHFFSETRELTNLVEEPKNNSNVALDRDNSRAHIVTMSTGGLLSSEVHNVPIVPTLSESRPFGTPGPTYYPEAGTYASFRTRKLNPPLLAPKMSPPPDSEAFTHEDQSCTTDFDPAPLDLPFVFGIPPRRHLEGDKSTELVPRSFKDQSVVPSPSPIEVNVDFRFERAPDISSTGSIKQSHASSSRILPNETQYQIGEQTMDFIEDILDNNVDSDATIFGGPSISHFPGLCADGVLRDNKEHAMSLPNTNIIPYSYSESSSSELDPEIHAFSSSAPFIRAVYHQSRLSPDPSFVEIQSPIHHLPQDVTYTANLKLTEIDLEGEDIAQDSPQRQTGESDLDDGSDKENERPQSGLKDNVRFCTPHNEDAIASAAETNQVISDDSGIGLQDNNLKSQNVDKKKAPQVAQGTLRNTFRPHVDEDNDEAQYWSQFSDDSIESWGVFDSLDVEGDR